MARHDCFTLVFSSSATVYGPDAPLPYSETYEPLRATNPYGWTKAMIEQIVTDVADGVIDMGLVNHYYLYSRANELGEELEEGAEETEDPAN